MVLNYIYLAQVQIKEKSSSDPAQHKAEVYVEGRGSGPEGGVGMVRSCVTGLRWGRAGRAWGQAVVPADNRVYMGVGIANIDQGGRPSQLPGRGFMGRGSSSLFIF